MAGTSNKNKKGEIHNLRFEYMIIDPPARYIMLGKAISYCFQVFKEGARRPEFLFYLFFSLFFFLSLLFL